MNYVVVIQEGMNMREIKIQISSLERAAKFAEIMEKENIKADISVGKYCLDAKSLMGLVTMDLNKTLNLVMYEDEWKIDRVVDQINDYVI